MYTQTLLSMPFLLNPIDLEVICSLSGKAEPNEAASLPSNRSQSSHGVDSDRNYYPKRWNKLSVSSEVETECQRLKGWRRPSLGCRLIVLSEVETTLCAEGEALTRGRPSK